MKKQRLISMLLLLVFAFTIVPVSYAAIISTYYDANFDSSNDLDGMSWAVSPDATDNAQDVAKANKSMKVTMNSTNSDGFARLDYNSVPATFADLSGKVLWTEVSFKYDGSFAQFGPEFGTGIHPVLVDANGKVKIYGWNWSGGSEVAQLELGEWYHLVISQDFTEPEDGKAIMKVWLNGTPIVTYDYNSNIALTSDFKYYRWRVDKPASDTMTLWLDNIKSYVTDAMDTHAETDFADTAITDADDSDEITLEDDTISAPEGTTMTDLLSALSTSGTMVFVKNGTVVSDNAYAWGAKLYVNASNGIAVKCYTILVPGDNPGDLPNVDPNPEPSPDPDPDPEPDTPPSEDEITKRDIVTEWYWDADFEAGSDSATNAKWSNASEGALSAFEQTHDGANAVKTLVTDPKRGNKAISFTPTPGSTGSSPFTRLGTETGFVFGNRVLWLEISFKFDDAFMKAEMNIDGTNNGSGVENAKPFKIDANGSLSMQGTSCGTLELDTWYHLVLAYDCIGNTHFLSMWLNGEEIQRNGQTSAIAVNNVRNIRFVLTPNSSDSSTMWLDNIKLYATQTALANSVYDGTVSFEGADLSSNILDIDSSNGAITVPEEFTIGDIYDSVNVSANGMGIYKNGSYIDDALITTELAQGAILYARSSDGVGVKKYTITTGKRTFDVVDDPIWDTTTNEGKVSVKFNMQNTSSEKNAVLVLAAYNVDGSLISHCTKNITVAAGATSALVESALLDLKGKSNPKVVAYIWDDMDTSYPLIKALEK